MLSTQSVILLRIRTADGARGRGGCCWGTCLFLNSFEGTYCFSFVLSADGDGPWDAREPSSVGRLNSVTLGGRGFENAHTHNLSHKNYLARAATTERI